MILQRKWRFRSLCSSARAPLSLVGHFGSKSGRDTAKMAGVNYRLSQTMAPIVLGNTASSLEARVTRNLDVCTHTISIGKVVDADILSERPCMTYDYYHEARELLRQTPPRAIFQKRRKQELRWQNTDNQSAAGPTTPVHSSRLYPVISPTGIHSLRLQRSTSQVALETPPPSGLPRHVSYD